MKKSLVSEIWDSTGILSHRDKKRFNLVLIAQATMGLIDLIAIGMMGVIGALSVRGIQSQPSGTRVLAVLEFLHLETLTFQLQITILSLLVVFLFTTRTIMTIVISRRILHFLGLRAAEISSNLVSKLLAGNLVKIQGKTTYDVQYAIGPGVSALILGVLGVSANLVADFSLLIIIGIGIFVIDSATAITALVMFGLMFLVIYAFTHKRARRLGESIAYANIQTNKLISEVMAAYKEIYTRSRRNFYNEEIEKVRKNFSSDFAEQTFLPSISKYVIELCVVLGTIAVAGVQFYFRDAAEAASGLALFFAASSRIAPALLRLQQSLIQIQGNLGASLPTKRMIFELNNAKLLAKPINRNYEISHENFIGQVDMRNLDFSYGNSESFRIRNLNLHIPAGQFVAIAGSSGSGKSTIVDLILGLLYPTSGEVIVSGVEPATALDFFPGSISYVPQNVILVDGTLRQNVTLGFPESFWTDEQVTRTLEDAQLKMYLANLPNGLDSRIGESGVGLSGGQKQRLGLARAYLTNPKLLILDEATSALDGTTELEVTNSINNIRPGVTLIVIAHRLSTIKKADYIYYVENGQIISSGSFQKVRGEVKEFDDQARAMGL
jgi:ATP-binding cassette subfamily C protein